MRFITEKNVSKFTIYLFIIIMSLMVVSISYYYVQNAYDDFDKDMKNFVQEYYNTQKQAIQKEVEIVLDIIQYHAVISTPKTEASIKEEVARMLNNISFQETKSNYIFVYDIKNMQGGDEFAVMLVNPNRPDLLGKTISTNYEDENGKRFREDFLNDIRKNGESFTQYAYKKPSDQQIKQKLSYFKYFQEWNWIVAAGVYLDDIEKAIEKKREILQKTVQKRVAQTIFIFLGFLSIAIAFSVLVSQKIEEFFSEYKQKVQKKSQDLIELNKNLERRVAQELSKNREKEQLLIQKSKFIALGEMISNIAHQWRQPLSELSVILMGIKFKESKGKLNSEYLKDKLNQCDHLIEYMSHTIDDFRDFFMPKKSKELFQITQCVQSVMNIVHSSLVDHNIEVKVQIDEKLELENYRNEFEQVILNIITNAKDVFILNEIKEAKMDIYTQQDENSISLIIEDNAGGIKIKPISKIFEPYFSSKERETGIGLYMSKIIIEKNMKGKLKVSNTPKGARFEIIL
jgi:C4-dicarboxylate-specific signal transduction histidine kinase